MTDRPSLTRCLATLGSAVAVVVILFAGLVLGTTPFFSTADKTEQAPATGDTPLIIAAIGDAYMSGEGATAFFPGTDRPGRNQCRRTSASYPFLLAANLAPGDGHDGIALVSAACSGARTTHLIPFEGISCQDDWFPDGCPEPQYEFVSDGRSDPAFQVERIPENADIVLVSVGAADAQLNDVIATYGASQTSCRASVMPWIDAFDATLQWRLRSVYAAVRKVAPNAEVVALTYPIPIFREACGSIRLDQDETDLIIDDFIPRLNEQISLAAAAERIRLVDLSEVFAGHRLCQPDRPGGEQPEIAMNAYQVRPVRGLTWKFSTWFHGSFYPSEFGHEIIAERLVRALIFVRTAADLNPDRMRAAGRRWMEAAPHRQRSYEWAYSGVPTRIFAEEVLPGFDEGESPPDLKIFVFGGQARFLYYRDAHRGDLGVFSRDWKLYEWDRWERVVDSTRIAYDSNVPPPAEPRECGLCCGVDRRGNRSPSRGPLCHRRGRVLWRGNRVPIFRE